MNLVILYIKLYIMYMKELITLLIIYQNPKYGLSVSASINILYVIFKRLLINQVYHVMSILQIMDCFDFV